jgi:hypothetical protein
MADVTEVSIAPRMSSTELRARHVIGMTYEDRHGLPGSTPEQHDDGELIKVIEMMASLVATRSN